jgi:hypothetical protein
MSSIVIRLNDRCPSDKNLNDISLGDTSPNHIGLKLIDKGPSGIKPL